MIPSLPALIIGVFLLVELGALVLFCRSRCASDGNGVVSLPLVSFFGGAFFFSVLAIIFLGSLIHVDLATQPALIWASGGVISGLIAFGVARRFESLFGAELLLAVIFSVQALAVAALWSGPSVDWTAPELRSLIVAPFILALASYFGSSLGLLLAGGGFSGGLGYESFVSLRFLLTRSSRALSTVTTISVVGVALGVWLVIISLGILSGFENDLQEKIIGANAHILLHKSSGRPFPISDSLTTKVEAQSGVSATAPFVEGDVALASESNYTAGLLHGIDIKRSPKVLDILSTLKFGRLEDLVGEKTKQVAEADSEFGFAAPRKSPGIMLGVEMAKALNVTLGDQVRVISPLHEVLTPVGVAPRSLGYRVVAIFDSGMYDHDARYAYVDIDLAREFFELKTDEVSGVQIRTDDSRYSASVASSLGASISEFDLEALDWKARNRTLFAALELERIVAFVVLVFIILVASFSIVNTLTMSVIEKRREIAILKTMGARDTGVLKLFLLQGLFVGGFGTLLGGAFASLSAWALTRFGFWIPRDVYYIDALPVHLEVLDVVLVLGAALLIVWDFAVFPALRAAKMIPVDGLRDG